MGTGAGYVALLLLTTNHLHSSWAVAAVLLADFLPATLLGSWFGALADRYPRRQLIVIANVLQAGAYGGLAFVDTGGPIFALAVLAGLGNALQRPALRSALPVVAGDASQLAVALYDTCRWAGITLGPALAAALFAISGVSLPLILNGASFLVAAVVMTTIPIARSKPETDDGEEEGGGGLRAGLRVAFSSADVATVIACSAGSLISGGLLNVCEPLLARRVLHGSGSAYALLVAAYGVGMVAATALVAQRGTVEPNVLIRRYLAALTLTALGMFGSAIVGSIPPAAVAFAATGYANALVLVSETQLIQLRVPSSVQGRLFGSKDTIDGSCLLTGFLGAGALVALSGVRLTLGIGAAVCAVCALAATAALRGSARHAISA